MKFIERFSGIFLLAGVLALLGGMVSLGFIPVHMVEKLHPHQGLPESIPEDFKPHYSTVEAYHTGLVRGRDVYIAEGCWHCHSQYVRPISNENLMYGPVSTPQEYQNILNRPQLFGTRRVGPDLSREAGKRTNDWHFAHLYKPTNVEPQSVMPEYPWLFEEKEGTPTPNEKGIALVAYLQWLGSGVKDRQETAFELNQMTMPPSE